MYRVSSFPFGRMNIKAAMLVPILLLSMFTVVPIVTSQIAPNIAKISPTLLNEMANAGESVNVLIKTLTNDYSNVVNQINNLGGKVGYLFKYVSGLSASLPAGKILELSRNSLVERIDCDVERRLASGPGASLMGQRGDDLDELLSRPTVLEAADYETVSVTPVELAGSDPSNYWNTKAMGAEEIWEETNYGEGSLVVIIDSGIWTGHFMFGGASIIGGVDLSYDAGDPTYGGWSNINNYWHGGHVAGTIASTGGVIARPGTRFYIYALALEKYSGVPLPTYPDGRKIIWLLGMAPAASLYIVKVFDHTGGAIPESMVIAGMEYALDLKLNPPYYDVDIISMSIGGPTVFDGRDIEDLLVNTITENDITLVAAAGNDGPASMIVSSPGSAYTAITAGAAANPVNTKAFWDYNYQWLGIGPYLFTSPTPQIYAFSSRGPTSDGRLKPTLSATGIYVLSAYTTGGNYIAWGSGTSMATPAISGATALLNTYSEMNGLGASPEDYKEALTGGAVLLPGYNQYDQGAGYLNARYALNVLKVDPEYGSVAPPFPPTGTLMDITNIPIVGSGSYSEHIDSLAPGLKCEYIFTVTEATSQVRVYVSNVILGPDPLKMNSFEVYVQSAKRTFYNYFVDSANVYGNAWFLITDGKARAKGKTYGALLYGGKMIEPGYMKVVIENDWTSFVPMSCDIRIEVRQEAPTTPNIEITGTIAQDDWLLIPISVQGWAKEVQLELWWVNDWTKYPTSDIDMYVWSEGEWDIHGATLNSPEYVKVPAEKTLYILLNGYAVFTGVPETFSLRIYFLK